MASFRRQNDEQVLAAAVGDAEAFGVYYDRMFPRVLAFVRPRVDSTEVAFDLTAETFARCLEGVGRFQDQGRGSAAAWTFAIARNLLIDSYRRHRVADDARRRLGLDPVALPDDDLQRLDELAESAIAELAEALDELPLEQREALLERVVDERSYQDIAAGLEISEAVVRKRVSRGLGRLRARLKEAR